MNNKPENPDTPVFQKIFSCSKEYKTCLLHRSGKLNLFPFVIEYLNKNLKRCILRPTKIIF